MHTIQEAKDYIFNPANFKNDGVRCPCCSQRVKLYKRRLTGTQMKGLSRLVRLYSYNQIYHHISTLRVSGNGGEFAQLERFGLITKQLNEDKTKRVSGMWMPTQKGIDFIHDKIAIPEYCTTYNGDTYGFSSTLIKIGDAINKKFSYHELMNC